MPLKEPTEGRELDFESDIAIDATDLEYEWIRQASLYQAYSVELANTIRDRDAKKELLTAKKSELDLEIRADWGEYGFNEKPKESGITACIALNEEVIQMTEELNFLNFEIKRFEGIRQAFEHKKSALEYITRLRLGGIFSEPKIPAESQEKAEAIGRSIEEAGLKKNPRLQIKAAKSEK